MTALKSIPKAMAEVEADCRSAHPPLVNRATGVLPASLSFGSTHDEKLGIDRGRKSS